MSKLLTCLHEFSATLYICSTLTEQIYKWNIGLVALSDSGPVTDKYHHVSSLLLGVVLPKPLFFY